MLRSCSRCGRIHDSSYKCNSGRLPRTQEQALRNLNRWHKKSEEIRERSFHFCAVCFDNKDYTPKDLETHHIIKLRDYPDGLLEDDNLIALCIDHHKQADRGEIDISYLRELVKRRDTDQETFFNDKDSPPRGIDS